MTATYTAASSATPRRCPHLTNPPISFLDTGISMHHRPQTIIFLSPAPSLTSTAKSETQISGSPQRTKHPSALARSASLSARQVATSSWFPLLCIVCLAMFHVVPRTIWSGGAFRRGLVDLATVALDLCQIGGEINFFTVYWFQAYF
jgi:hypothetical protein